MPQAKQHGDDQRGEDFHQPSLPVSHAALAQFAQGGEDQHDRPDDGEVDAEVEEHGRGQLELADQRQVEVAEGGGEKGPVETASCRYRWQMAISRPRAISLVVVLLPLLGGSRRCRWPYTAGSGQWR